MAKTKIAVKTKIRMVTIKTNDKGRHADIKFSGLDYSEEQLEKLELLAEGREEIMLAIEPVQEGLPGM